MCGMNFSYQIEIKSLRYFTNNNLSKYLLTRLFVTQWKIAIFTKRFSEIETFQTCRF